MRTLFISVFLICTFCLINVSSAATAPVLRVAVDAPYPPFAEYDKSGALVGFDVDFAHALCKELGRTCEVKAVPFDAILPAIAAGEIDIAVAGMGASEERKQLVDFTDRYFRSLSIFIEKEGTLRALTPDTIKGKRVGAQQGTLQAGYLEKTYGDTVTLMTRESYDEIFLMLNNNELDLVFIDGLPGYTYLKSDMGVGLETIGEPVDSGGVMDWASIAVSKQQPALREAINAAIQQLRRSGEYGRINRKYFDFNIY